MGIYLLSELQLSLTAYELPYSLILEVQVPVSWNVSGMGLGGSVSCIAWVDSTTGCIAVTNRTR